MNRKLYSVLLLLLVWCGIFGSVEVRAGDHVLVVSSYSPVREQGNGMINGLVEHLSLPQGTKLTVEYMDCESQPAYEEWKAWFASLYRVFDSPPRLIVLLGGEAWSAYRHTVPPAWRSVPVVLGDVKNGYIDYEHMTAERIRSVAEIPSMQSTFDGLPVTGYSYKDYIPENIDLIRRLQPDVERIMFYFDDRYRHDFFEEYLRRIVERDSVLALSYLVGSRLSTSDLLDSIDSQNETCALLSGGWYTDRNHYPHAATMLENELARTPRRVVYLMQDQNFRRNDYLGGYFVSGAERGRDLAGLVEHVFEHGIEGSPAFGPTPTPPRYHINRNALELAGIDPARLPANAILHNTDPSLLEKYPVQVAVTGSLALLLVMALAFYLLNRSRRDRLMRESARRQQDLLESMPNMAVILDEHLVIRDIVHPQRELLLGYAPESIKGVDVRRLAGEAPRFAGVAQTIRDGIVRCQQTGSTVSFDYHVRYDSGYHAAEVKAVPYNGRQVIAFVQDVTAREQAERRAETLDSFLRLVFDNLPVGIFVKDVSNDFRYVFFNPAAGRFYRVEPKSVLGHNDTEIGDPLADQYRAEDLEALRSGGPMTLERTMEGPEGLGHAVATKSALAGEDGSRYVITTLVDTTQIRRKETELENAHNQLMVALEAGMLSAWLYDVERSRFSSLYGQTVSDNDPTLEDVYGTVHPDCREKLRLFMDALISGRETKRREMFRFRREQGWRWYETHAVAQRSVETGRICRIIGTEKDITDELEEHRELTEGRMRLELAFVAADMVPWDYDAVEDRFSSSSTMSVVYSRGLSLAACTEEIFLGEYGAIFNDRMQDLIAGRIETMDEILRIRKPDGGQEWSHMKARALSRDDAGRALSITGTRKFVTAAVEAEKQLQQINFRSDLAIRSSGSVLWDYDLVEQRLSSPDKESFMYKGTSSEKYVSMLHPDDRHLFREALENIMEGKEDRIHLQLRLIEPGKEGYRWADIHGAVFERDRQGRPTKLTGLRRDVTEWRRMTDELIVLRDKAEEASRLKSAFLANMSHEIRTPLNAIVGFSNLLAQTDDVEQREEFCRIIETNNELLLQLINDILDLSKIEAGQMEFTFSDVSAHGLVQDLVHTFSYRAREGVVIRAELPERDCTFHSERNRLMQVLSNFLSNACKFTFEGSITIGYEYIPGGLRFFVTDTGKGIAKENVGHVFERFAKFDAFIQGTGLGLSISKTIIDILGGEIGVESEEGKGSTFWCTVPCEDGRQGEKEDALGGQTPRELPVILVAEDDDSNYLLLECLLRGRYRLVRAVNGREAVRLYEEVRPGLILMDIKMPVLDGLSATRLIRKKDAGIPIVALTAHAFEDDRKQASDAGCTDFLTKPVDRATLERTIVRYLSGAGPDAAETGCGVREEGACGDSE